MRHPKRRDALWGQSRLSISAHPRESGDPGPRTPVLVALDSRVRGNERNIVISGASMQTHQAEAGGGEATPTDAKPVTPADAKQMQEKCEAAEGGSNAEVVEATLHAIMACVRAVVNAIARSASADPKDDEAGTTGACRL